MGDIPVTPFLCLFCEEELEEPRRAYGVYYMTMKKVHCHSCLSTVSQMLNNEEFVSRHYVVYHQDTYQKYSEDVIIDDIWISIHYESDKTTIYQYIEGGPFGWWTNEILTLSEILDIYNPNLMDQINLWKTFS